MSGEKFGRVSGARSTLTTRKKMPASRRIAAKSEAREKGVGESEVMGRLE